MKQLPDTENPLVIRTDFSNEAAWEAIRATLRRLSGFFLANVDFLDDPANNGLTKDQLLQLVPGDYRQTFVILVDRLAVVEPDHPLLVVDLFETPGKELRAIPTEVGNIENNLSIVNMDFDDFVRAADKDGVFRGYRR